MVLVTWYAIEMRLAPLFVYLSYLLSRFLTSEEAHQGSDGRYYLLDFARVFPAQAQIFNKKSGTSIFYELLRPELLPIYKSRILEMDENFDFHGLSSDAFAGSVLLIFYLSVLCFHSIYLQGFILRLGWGKYDPKSTVHNDEVISCTRFLFEQVIPKFVEDYSNSYKNTGKEKLTPSHQRSLCILMHKAGIVILPNLPARLFTG
jgi:hypothetical protein